MPNWTLEIRRPNKPTRQFPVAPGVYPVGSDADNGIILPDPSVSWRHAVLSILDDGVFIEDLMSEGGTFVDGVRVEGRRRVQPGQVITMGCYTLVLSDGSTPAAAPAPAAAAPAAAIAAAPTPPAAAPSPVAAPSAVGARAEEERRRSIRRQIQQELLKRLDIKRMAAGHVNEKDLRAKAYEVIHQIIRDVRDRLPPDIQPEALVKEVYDEALGLGPLEDLLADPEITEIMVNGPNRIYIERDGKLHLTGKTFLDDDSVLAVIERIVSPIGRRIDESQP